MEGDELELDSKFHFQFRLRLIYQQENLGTFQLELCIDEKHVDNHLE
jgi:hypothetical protein